MWGKGVGKVLLDFVICIFCYYLMCEIWLDVRESNYIVIGFYLFCGFEYIDICKNYYIIVIGKENVLVMKY